MEFRSQAWLNRRPRRRGQLVRDSLLNGTLIGLVAGAGLGTAVIYRHTDTHEREDFLRGALFFGGFGAAIGLGIDALLQRDSPVNRQSPQRPSFGLIVSPKTTGLGVFTRW